MVAKEDKALAGGEGGGGGSVALGKGAWDCDKNCEIPPEKEVELSKFVCNICARRPARS